MTAPRFGLADNRPALNRTVALIGLMGAGKSTVGRRLADMIGAQFVDSDAEIEAAAGMTVPEIFAAHGEPAFRDGERRIIDRLMEEPPLVLATGGGAFMDADTRALLKQRAVTVWLRAELDVLVKRCAKRDTRPLLRQGNPSEILAGLIETRYPIYEEADVIIDSVDGPHDVAVRRVLTALEQMGAASS